MIWSAASASRRNNGQSTCLLPWPGTDCYHTGGALLQKRNLSSRPAKKQAQMERPAHIVY